MSTAARYRISQKGKMKCPGPEIITNPQNLGEGKIKEESMKPVLEEPRPGWQKDRIEGRTIVLDSQGGFPKKLIILEGGVAKEYQIIKTRKGGYLLN